MVQESGYQSETASDVFAQLRRRMVEEQLRGRGIQDERVLAAMGRVAREEFVPSHLRASAYGDTALPIGYDQTISQPFTVAFMCEAAQLQGYENVLEIGAGSGYGAAILGELARQVTSIERVKPLAELAHWRIQQMGYRNVTVHYGNGIHGFVPGAPYDAIIVTAGAVSLPESYVDQLADGGRIIIPVGHYWGQEMMRFTKHGMQLHGEKLGGFSFVPLVD